MTLNRLKLYFNTGHKRTIKIKQNVIWILALRGTSTFIGFALVPLTLNYLNPVKYGLWLTLGSIIAWFSFLDIGFSSGLRNKLSEALARNDIKLARHYTSTTYAVLVLIMTVVFAVFFLINKFINWEILLMAPPGTAQELNQLAFWMLFFFGIKFVFDLIDAVLKADQKPAIASSFAAISSILSLAAVYILLNTTSNSLFYLGFWRSFCAAIVPVAAVFWFFSRSYRNIAPSWRFVDFSYVKDIMGLGIQFFLIQLCSIIIFSSSNIIISHLFGPQKVTPYVIVYQYFYIITIVFSTISMPLWSAYTEAYVKKDYVWIKSTLRKMLSLLLPTLFVVVTMIVIAKPFIIYIWIGQDVGIEMLLVCCMGFYVMLQAWNVIFSWFLNGIGQIRCTLYTMMAGALINIPSSIFFAKTLGLGISGVILGTILSLSIFSIIAPFQVYKIIKNGNAPLCK